MPLDPERVYLPSRPFFYTLDQICQILSITMSTLKKSYIYWDGLSVGIDPTDLITAREITPPGISSPVWRVSEQELIRWCRRRGFKYSERGWLK